MTDENKLCEYCDGTGEVTAIMPNGDSEYMGCSNCNGMDEIEEATMTDEHPINWIHPELLDTVQEWVPDDVKQINAHTYEIFNAVFIVAGENVTVGDMMIFLRDNGWDPNSKKDNTDDSTTN